MSSAHRTGNSGNKSMKSKIVIIFTKVTIPLTNNCYCNGMFREHKYFAWGSLLIKKCWWIHGRMNLDLQLKVQFEAGVQSDICAISVPPCHQVLLVSSPSLSSRLCFHFTKHIAQLLHITSSEDRCCENYCLSYLVKPIWCTASMAALLLTPAKQWNTIFISFFCGCLTLNSSSNSSGSIVKASGTFLTTICKKRKINVNVLSS